MLALAAFALALPGGAVASTGTRGAVAPPGTTGAVVARSFGARVVSAGPGGLVLQRAGGGRVTFAAGQVAGVQGAPAPSGELANGGGGWPGELGTELSALQPGVTVLVIETGGPGRVTIAVPSGSAAGVGGERQAAGVVRDIDHDALLLEAAGSPMMVHLQQGTPQSRGVQVCSTVRVSYHQGAGVLVADALALTGASTAGPCADNVASRTLTGTIVSVSARRLTVLAGTGTPMRFAVGSPGLTASFARGDYVQVTYRSGTSGTPVAGDVEYVEATATGKITGLGPGRLQLGSGARRVVYTADPAAGMFAGLRVGEAVQVTYHRSGRRLVAEAAGPAAR